MDTYSALTVVFRESNSCLRRCCLHSVRARFLFNSTTRPFSTSRMVDLRFQFQDALRIFCFQVRLLMRYKVQPLLHLDFLWCAQPHHFHDLIEGGVPDVIVTDGVSLVTMIDEVSELHRCTGVTGIGASESSELSGSIHCS